MRFEEIFCAVFRFSQKFDAVFAFLTFLWFAVSSIFVRLFGFVEFSYSFTEISSGFSAPGTPLTTPSLQAKVYGPVIKKKGWIMSGNFGTLVHEKLDRKAEVSDSQHF